MTTSKTAGHLDYGREHRLYDVLDTERDRAIDVRGKALPCGHFFPEEAPQETIVALLDFFTD